MDSIAKINIKEFEKKSDGSWIALKNSDIVTEDGGVIRVTPGMVFIPGRQLWGFDVAKILNEISPN